VAVVARSLEVFADLAPLPSELRRAFELLHAAAHLRGLAVVVVDGRVAQALLRLAIRALQLVDQFVEIRHRGSVVALRPSLRRARRRRCRPFPARAPRAGRGSRPRAGRAWARGSSTAAATGLAPAASSRRGCRWG